MLNIVSSFQTNIKENVLGDYKKFKTSICFTIIMKEALDLQAHIIIRKPYENLESRGRYIITGYNTSKSFLEIKNILEKNNKENNLPNYKIWLLRYD